MPRTGRPPVPFWARVDMSGGLFACWPWTGPLYRDRRGHVWFQGRVRRVHQVAWILTNGPIPVGLNVLHQCDNQPCCNPAHLFVGTQADNVADMVAKGRQAAGDRNGSRRHPDRLRPVTGDAHWARRHPELVLRGERNGRTKLTASQLNELVHRYRVGGISQSALAREYGVSSSRIQQIVSAVA